MTKNGQIIFEEYNLGLNHFSQNYKQDGLASKVCNIECKNGSIRSSNELKDIFDLIEPTRSKSASDLFFKQVGKCLWVASFQFYNQAQLVDYVVFCSSDYKIFYYQLGAENPQFKCLNNIAFTSRPTYDFFIKDNKNNMIFCSQTDDMWVWNGMTEPYQVLDAPHVDSMAVGMDRLFVVSSSHPYSVLFSDDLDPSNWSMIAGEAGQVQFSDNLGKVLKVFALDNYIYVIRDYGIIKLYSYDQSENTFNISKVYFSTGNICKDTISLAGDKIVFMCDDKIYSFDGLNCKIMYNCFSGQIFNPNSAVGVCLNNIYYLCATLYEKSSANNAIICIDLESKSITNVHFDADFRNLSKINVKNDNILIVCFDTNDPKNAKTPLCIVKNVNKNAENCNFLYQTHFINLSPKSEDKVLTKLTFLSKYPATISIISDGQKKDFSVLGSDCFQTLKINLKGKIFSIKFSGNQNVDISHIKLDYCFVE